MKNIFVKHPLLAILILWTLVSCNKGVLNSYDVVQSNFITNATLDSMYIKPFKSQSLWKLTFNPKTSDKVITYYLEKQGDDSYNMFGQTRSDYHSIKINPILSTNSIAALIDFTEASYTTSIITIYDTEFTRGADHEYSFARSSTSLDTMFMEGVQYGDQLVMVALADNSEEAQFVKNGGIEKQFAPFENWCANTPFILWDLSGEDGSPMQAFIDPNEDEVWISPIGRTSFTYGAENNYLSMSTDYSGISGFTLNYGGDTLLLTTPYVNLFYTVVGFVFNKEKMIMKPIEKFITSNDLISYEATNQNMPGLSFVEMATQFYYDSRSEDANINSNSWAKNFHLQNSFTVYNDSVNNSSAYTANWSSVAKSQYLNMMNSIGQFYGGTRKVLGLSISIAPRQVGRNTYSANKDTLYSGGYTLDYQFNIVTRNGSSLDSLIYVLHRGGANDYTLPPSGVKYSTGSIWDNPGVTLAANISPKNTSTNIAAATTLWPSVYNFMKLFEKETSVSNNFLPRVDAYARFGVEITNTVNGEKFSGEVKTMAEY